MRPGLSGNPFFRLWHWWRRKKDWERKTEIVAQKKEYTTYL